MIDPKEKTVNDTDDTLAAENEARAALRRAAADLARLGPDGALADAADMFEDAAEFPAFDQAASGFRFALPRAFSGVSDLLAKGAPVDTARRALLVLARTVLCVEHVAAFGELPPVAPAEPPAPPLAPVPSHLA